MARIEDLIDEISDPKLREQIAREVKHLKTHKRFGLVYEEHVPETVALFGLQVRPGDVVLVRTEPDDSTRWEVKSVKGGKAEIGPIGDGEVVRVVPTRDLLVEKRFEEPIFPGLTPVGTVERGGDKPFHSVINAENFHALQLLAYTHAGKVDVIYIDPPYNTGARDWKYNNRYVDGNDAYRHSKWLAMMEKRLKLAEKLLQPDGVMIVTIDEREYLGLGLLLNQLFSGAQIQMVSIAVNPAAVARKGYFSRSDEYCFFVRFGSAEAAPLSLAPEWRTTPRGRTHGGEIRWDLLRRSGSSPQREGHPGTFYPIFVSEDGSKIEGIGDPLDAVDVPRTSLEPPPGTLAVWPIRKNGSEGRWSLGPEYVRRLLDDGHLRLGGFKGERTPIYYLARGERDKIATGDYEVTGRRDDGSVITSTADTDARPLVPSTQWRIASHDSTQYGTRLLARFLPETKFPFPKSLYAVADTLRIFVHDRPDAVVLDFFAGSATTTHAVALLNAQDGGSRLSLVVTNNDVAEAEVKDLNQTGYFVGDPEYEAQGIFEGVTKPRVEAALTGVDPDGKPVEGKYLDQYLPDHAYADGFEENVAFFRMDYLEPDLVELGRQYEAVAPLLWMAAGSVGSWEPWDGKAPWSAPVDSTYAVLFDEAEAAAFGAYVESRSEEITHVWIVTDSHSAFLDLQEALPPHVIGGQLYLDYLRNFVINTPGALG